MGLRLHVYAIYYSLLFMHVFAVKSFLELIEYIFKIPGVKFYLNEWMSQDPLENFFGCQRQRGEPVRIQQPTSFAKTLRLLEL